jgi:cell division protein FtsZ
MAEMGKAMMGTGEAEGDDRAVKAAEKAISNPLLDDASLRGARGVLINITGGYDMTLFEVDEAANRIRKEVDEDANIIFGSSIEEALNGRLRVSVVATGIDAMPVQIAAPVGKPEGLTVVAGGKGAPVAARPAASGTAGAQPGGPQRRVSISPGSFLRPAANGGAAVAMAHPEAVDPAPFVTVGPVAVADYNEAEPPETVAAPVAEPGRRAPPAANTGGGLGGLFRKVTGSGGLMRRNLPEAPHQAPVAPRVETLPEMPRQASRQTHQDEIGLDIPAFLRRQAN